MPQREGSPWRGVGVVFFRELFDHLTSVRMLVLELLVVLFGGVVVYFAAEQIRPQSRRVVVEETVEGRRVEGIGGFQLVDPDHGRRWLVFGIRIELLRSAQGQGHLCRR